MSIDDTVLKLMFVGNSLPASEKHRKIISLWHLQFYRFSATIHTESFCRPCIVCVRLVLEVLFETLSDFLALYTAYMLCLFSPDKSF